MRQVPRDYFNIYRLETWSVCSYEDYLVAFAKILSHLLLKRRMAYIFPGSLTTQTRCAPYVALREDEMKSLQMRPDNLHMNTQTKSQDDIY